MKFLIDNAVSPKVSEALSAIGFDAVHVREYGIQDATDEVIFDRAANEDRILISADTDFAFILSTRQVAAPSVILFRGDVTRNPQVQSQLLAANIAALEEDLIKGAVVVIEKHRIRIRLLPIG
jgi:predicted nuclease of predicted toxin-antitoxin system